MVMQPTADFLVGGSDPGQAKMPAATPTTVDRPRFESPTLVLHLAALPFDQGLL